MFRDNRGLSSTELRQKWMLTDDCGPMTWNF